VDGFVVHEVVADISVRVERSMPDLPVALDCEVERLWQATCKRVAAGGAGRLFNGRVFSIDSFAPERLIGHLTEYRRVVAQMEQPALFAELGVRPLAVCGVLRCADGVVVGRRHRGAVYQGGMWQLPPAGSVDARAVGADGAVDLRRQLLSELREEVGLTADMVNEPQPLCIVEHPGSHVSDFGLSLVTTLNAEAVLTAYQAGANGEYEQIRVIARAELPAFLAELGEALVPPAREFLIRVGLTNREAESSR
jgi:hypothetical protein